MENEKVFAMKLARIYPLLVNKALRKGRTQAEVDEVICWLTGYDLPGLNALLEQEVDYGTFLREAPAWNPNAERIKGVICGIRVENIQEPLMKRLRQLDKLVDELAKGRTMEKIKRN